VRASWTDQCEIYFVSTPGEFGRTPGEHTRPNHSWTSSYSAGVRLYLRSHDRLPDPAPLPTNDRATVLVGVAVWAALGVAAFLLRARLEATDRGWWVWTPPAGIILGLLGLAYLRARRRHDGPPPPPLP
jgi:hypothetical protein